MKTKVILSTVLGASCPSLRGGLMDQRSWRYASSEAAVASAIWAAIALPLTIGVAIWRHGFDADEVASRLGAGLGLLILYAILLSLLAWIRNRRNITSTVFLDWRFWGLALILAANPPWPVVGWLWIGLIYNIRAARKRERERKKEQEEQGWIRAQS